MCYSAKATHLTEKNSSGARTFFVSEKEKTSWIQHLLPSGASAHKHMFMNTLYGGNLYLGPIVTGQGSSTKARHQLLSLGAPLPFPDSGINRSPKKHVESSFTPQTSPIIPIRQCDEVIVACDIYCTVLSPRIAVGYVYRTIPDIRSYCSTGDPSVS